MGGPADVEENNLAQSISTIRKALAKFGGPERYIETIPARGYRFAGKVRESLPPHIERPRAVWRDAATAESHCRYVQGRYFWNKITEKDLLKAMGCFEQTLVHDPGCTLGHVGIADTYIRLGGLCFRDPNEVFAPARLSIQRALAIDAALPEAYASLAVLRMYVDWDSEGACAAFERAIDLDSEYAVAHQWYGWYLAGLGRFEESLKALRRAQELDPVCLMTSLMLGLCLQKWDLLPEATEQFRRVLDLDENFLLAHYSIGLTSAELGRRAEAEEAFRKALEIEPDSSLVKAALSHYLALWGRTGQAIRLRDSLAAPSDGHFVCAYHLATAEAGLGRTEEAFRALERAYRQRSPHLLWMVTDPLLKPLRGRRLDGLVERVAFGS